MQDHWQEKIIYLETNDTDQDDAEDAIEEQEIKITGLESTNEEKEDEITGVESVKEDNASTGVQQGRRMILRTHVTSTRMWLIPS